jgi:hypothetical protein
MFLNFNYSLVFHEFIKLIINLYFILYTIINTY